MKNIYIIALMLLIKVGSFAQTIDTDVIESEDFSLKGEHFALSQEELNKFKGIWAYKKNNIVIFKVRIDIENRVFDPQTESYSDKLIASYCFDENTSCFLNPEDDNVSFIDLGINTRLTEDLIKIYLKDNKTGKYGKAFFKLISSEQASWRLGDAYPNISFFDSVENTKEFSIPTNVTLTRVPM